MLMGGGGGHWTDDGGGRRGNKPVGERKDETAVVSPFASDCLTVARCGHERDTQRTAC